MPHLICERLTTMLSLGDYTIDCIVDNRIFLDAGSVFGIIPKSIWSKLQTADENNLIPFDVNVFVARGHGRTIIFDAGLGDFLEERQQKLYGALQPSRLISGLAALGIDPAQVDTVVLTHLHWDHAGGAFRRGAFGARLVFPNAAHYVHEWEWEDANHPDERTSGVYFPERLKALGDAGRLKLMTEDHTEIAPGFGLRRIGGHTRGQLGVEIESRGQKLIYYADNFPTCHHLKVPYVSATDLYPIDTQRCKRETLPRAFEGKWLIAIDHDLDCKIARLKYDGLKYTCEKVL